MKKNPGELEQVKKSSIYTVFNQTPEGVIKTKKEEKFEEIVKDKLIAFTKEEDEKGNKEVIEEDDQGVVGLDKGVEKEEKKQMPFWAEFLINILILVVLFVIVRSFIFVPFNIDGHSMEGQLHHGEFIYVDKATSYFRSYERGEIVVFIPPYKKLVKEQGALCLYHSLKNTVLFQEKEDPCLVQASFVKRVIGIEGDVIEIKGGHVYVTPKGGKKQEISQSFLLPKNQNKTCLPAGNCESKRSIDGQVYPPVPKGKIFVLGDNRTGSSDSRERSWTDPFVEEEKVVGIARAVFLSPPAAQERDPGFMGAMNAMFSSFSGTRILRKQMLLEE